MIRTIPFIILLIFFFKLPLIGDPGSKISVAILPFGSFDNTLISHVKKGIRNLYKGASITVLPSRDLPKAAFYRPRNRYRAVKLLTFLDSINSHTHIKIVGLTVKDISTTKGKYQDWGIFGLGTIGGKSCVVSTFRLARGKVSKTLFHRRLVDVVNHELGHTFGLDHCPHKGCIMEDAKGSIKTVDRSKGTFCKDCWNMLELIFKAM